jgi:transmembrane sensor
MAPFSKTPDDPMPPDGKADAAAWTLRLDRGLSPAEQDAYIEWLAADPRNGEAMQRYREHWQRLNKLADWRPEHTRRPNPDLLAPPRSRSWPAWRLAACLATAACMALAWVAWRPAERVEIAEPGPRHENRQLLPDRSTAKLGTGAEIDVRYTEGERRIVLLQGQAFFMVQRDPARPFVVEAAGIAVRAVGTAFDMRVGEASVDVVVAEGSVAVLARDDPDAGGASTMAEPVALVQALQQVSIPITSHTAAAVATLTKQGVQERLAWQHGLMTFRQKPLSEIVEELNWLNDTQLVLLDEALAATRFSGTIRSDNIDGFARLLESGFGARIEQAGDGEIRLRTKKDSI